MRYGAGSGTGPEVGDQGGGEFQAAVERNLCGLVGALSRQIEQHVRERAVRLNLTAPQATALRELSGPLTMRELAGRMGCEPSNATFVIDRLEEQGLVERRPHPSDRRAKQLSLTSEGTALRNQLLEILMEDSPMAGFTPQEQEMLQDLLQKALR
ncbi:MarR family transcriptional regulator [Nonomuraea sp. MG754425]|nr:MarR family transcriptional regulator [Nonomuraea sp. MG754425]